MMEFRDGFTPNWQENVGLPWNEYKLLERDKFEELVTMMIDAYPEHELTEWLKRGFCMNECCLLYTSPSPRDRQKSRMPSSA